MDRRVARNRQYLANLFAGPFPGHAIIVNHEAVPFPGPGDLASSDLPVTDCVDWGMSNYEGQLEVLEVLDDDSVPHVKVSTGTQVFAAAFGCPVHMYEDSNPCALPLVARAEEADRLDVPDLCDPPLDRLFEYGALMRERIGPDVPISVPDIQSPFDIAALIWRKEDLYVAVLDEPDAVKRLVDKCHILLERFLHEWIRQFPECSLAHCPNAWAPPELGMWLSEDEAGAMSTRMFEEFCIPGLARLSEAFGGIFIHCCADADHQYDAFGSLPNLRGVNRVFQASGPGPAIEAFSGQAVLMQAWTPEDQIHQMLDMALPDTRFLFNLDAQPIDQAKRTYERLRERCPRL